MTCIVGIARHGIVTIGGDSAGVDESFRLQIRADAKVFSVGEFVIGGTSSFRMLNVLRFFKPPDQPERMDLFEYMVTLFVESARTAMKAAGFAKVDNQQESGGQFLVGYRGRLFAIDADFQVGEMISGLAAVGCGDQAALGALMALTPKELACCPSRQEVPVKAALEIAEQLCAGVRGPFVIVATKPNEEHHHAG